MEAIQHGSAEDLETLASRIKDDLKAAELAARERMTRYRSAGDRLLKAKAVLPRGSWTDWLKANVCLSERQAQKYMNFAKAPREADWEEEEKLWRRASGSGGSKRKKVRPVEPDLPEDGSRLIELVPLPKHEIDQIDIWLSKLMKSWGTQSVTETVVEAIRLAAGEIIHA